VTRGNPRSGMKYALLLLALVACNVDIDEPWELDHDRIIAVRATPPGISPGETSTIDLLAGFETNPAVERRPDFVQVVSPMSLSDLVQPSGGGNWTVTAPTAERLDAARTELNIPAGMPVPLRIGVAAAWPTPVMSPEGNGFGAVKIVWLGISAPNPTLNGLTVNGVDAPEGASLVVPKAEKVPLFVDANDEVQIVNWLSSAGTMHDFDLHSAYLTFDDPEDKLEGQLAVVLRDALGGVAWRVWSIRAE
jgi:hypothetical protein